MQQAVLLWVNLTGETGERGIPMLCTRLESHCRLQRCNDPDQLLRRLELRAPAVICFDCANPGTAERGLVQTVKLRYPSIPLLVFTTSETADIFIWALRTRVWDCFIKPVSCGEVLRRLNILLPVLDPERQERNRQPLLPERGCGTPSAPAPGGAVSRTAAVLPQLKHRMHEKIALSEMADACGMNAFEFSRWFHREHGVTFRDYLMRLRIETAARRLRRDAHTVLDIACSVGFNDPSHFARLFRRYMGVTPSVYRSERSAAVSAG